MKRRTGLGILLALGLASVASAQGAEVEGIVVGPGGLCLDLEGSWSAARPPPDGTPVVLSVCDGSDDQRWQYGIGDGDGLFVGLDGATLAVRGQFVVAVHESATRGPRFRGSGPMTFASGCLTSRVPAVPGERLRVTPCDGSAGQQLVLR